MRKILGALPVLIGLLLYLQPQARAATVINFDNLNDGDVVSNQYPGLTFSNAIILTAGISLNEFEFPPHSGSNVVSDNGGAIMILFGSPVASFGAYFTYSQPLALIGLDTLSNQVSVASSAFSANLALSGDPGSSSNEFLHVSSAGGISSITIIGNSSGGSFVMDDVTYTSAAPESGSAVLFLIATIALATRKFKHAMKAPKSISGSIFALLLLLGGGCSVSATPVIGPVVANPTVVSVSTPTLVTITVQITDSTLISGSVNLLRLGAPGTQPTIVGVMHDDGLNGDLMAGDHVFTLQLVLREPYPLQVGLQASASFRGVLRRVTSPAFQLRIRGLELSDLATTTPTILDGRIKSINSYLLNGFIFSDIQLTVVQTVKGNTSSNTVTVRVAGGTIGNVTQQPLGATTFASGEEVLLLLQGPDSNAKYYIPDGSLGSFHVRTDAVLGKVAVVDAGYDAMELAFPLDPTFVSLLLQSSQGQLSLTVLVQSLSTP